MMPTPTTVISVRGKSRDALLSDPNFVYVGRKVQWTQWANSPWGNPFGFGNGGFFVAPQARDWWDRKGKPMIGFPDNPVSMLDLYDAWLDSRHDLIARLPELLGKTLGCWCGTWAPGDPPIPCHAHRLAMRANRLAGVDVIVREVKQVAQQGRMF